MIFSELILVDGCLTLFSIGMRLSRRTRYQVCRIVNYTEAPIAKYLMIDRTYSSKLVIQARFLYVTKEILHMLEISINRKNMLVRVSGWDTT